MSRQVQVGDRIKFRNMPANYPRATIVEVGTMSFKCKLDEQITEMGYPETDVVDLDVNSTRHKPKLKREIVVFNRDEIEIIS